MTFSLNESSQWEYLFLSSSRRELGSSSPGKSLRHSASVPDDLLQSNEDENASKSENDVIERHLDPPPSWVNEIMIDRSKYLLRYPPLGRRTIQYFKAKVDYYSKNQHPQAMVMRVIIYLDSSKIVVKEIHEWYENRKDKMYKRVRYVLEGKFIEEYFPGSVGEVKKWVEYPGKRRDIDFYVNGRLDRMYRREEIIGEKISEYFQGRTDFLTYRSILLTLNKEKVGSKTSYSLPSGGLVNDLYVLRINQSYDHDPNAASGTDIAHRTFHIPEGRVITQYHFVTSKITQKIKVHSHAKSNAGVLTGGEELSPEDLEGIQEAALIERECFSAVKLSYVQIMNIIKIRSEYENTGNIMIEKTVFENALERAEKGVTGAVGVEEDEGHDTKGIDYLTPYLRNIKDIKNITKEEALEVRQACLDALKARLVERANIIQSRLNEETAKLARKQEQFQRSQREGDLSTEEYEKYCTEAMFRIQILEQRLVAHEESAIQKFGKLDSRLSTEPRLAVLLKKD